MLQKQLEVVATAKSAGWLVVKSIFIKIMERMEVETLTWDNEVVLSQVRTNQTASVLFGQQREIRPSDRMSKQRKKSLIVTLRNMVSIHAVITTQDIAGGGRTTEIHHQGYGSYISVKGVERIT